MDSTDNRSIAITETRRSGKIIYREPGAKWPFIGDRRRPCDAILQTGTREVWKPGYRLGGRPAFRVLRFVAAETVRHRAPLARAELTRTPANCTEAGSPSGRPLGPPTSLVLPPAQPAVRLALSVLAAAVHSRGFMWLKNAFLSIDPKGHAHRSERAPETHIAR